MALHDFLYTAPTATFSQRDPPEIRHPDGSRTEKVELGKCVQMCYDTVVAVAHTYISKILNVTSIRTFIDIQDYNAHVFPLVLGQNHTLQCEIYFPFEMNFLPKVLWYVNYGGNTKNTTLLDLEKPE